MTIGWKNKVPIFGGGIPDLRREGTLPWEALKTGESVLVQGLGVPKSSAVVVLPSLGLLGTHTAGSVINRTSIMHGTL
jgi:hypothetical protein